MKRILLVLTLAVLCTGAMAQKNYDDFLSQVPFGLKHISTPDIPDYTVRLTDFGAVGDGQTLCTKAFEKAMEQLKQRGGGHLVVPAGIWHTGPIVMVSNVDLHLNMGAVILFAADEKLYPLVKTSFEGLDTYRCQSPLSGNGLTNVSITGQGVIDGNGQYWRPVKKSKVTESHWKSLLDQPDGKELRKGYWVPSASYAEGEASSNMNVPQGMRDESQYEKIKRFLRPVMVSLVNCKNVLLEGVIFQNSPAWNLHPLICENVIIDNVLVRNPSYAQNGDALDLESCKNALIVNSKFDAGDDGICIKSGKDADGRKRGIPCENVVVDGCTVFAGHGGFVVGSEMSGGVKDILVRNCQFVGTDVGLRFKSTRGRGGVVENIYIDNISMTGIKTDAVTFNMYYGGKSVAEALADGDKPNNSDKMPVDETTPVFRHIFISDIVCYGAGRAMEFNGLPEMPMKDINLRNINIIADKDAEFHNCDGVKQENVKITVRKD